jgi:hypothetical protein
VAASFFSFAFGVAGPERIATPFASLPRICVACMRFFASSFSAGNISTAIAVSCA